MLDGTARRRDIHGTLPLTPCAMPRSIRWTLAAFALIVVGLYGYESAKNPEHADISDADRALQPGHFIGLTHGITHYEIAGPDTGRVVVMVHGFSVPSYIWDSTFNALSNAGFRTVRYDLYGRGFSDRPDVAYDGALYDAQLEELLTKLYIDQPIDLMGLSFGGFVTAHFTATHPERIRTLTLVDPSSSASTMPAYMKWPIVGPFLFQTQSVPGMADGQAGDFLHPELHPTWADQYRPQMQYRGFGRALLRSRIALSETNFDSLFTQVGKTNIPVLLVWGKQDPVIPIAQASIIQRAIPGVDFFPVDSAGHLPHMEQTATVNAKLLQFLAGH